MYFIPVVLFVLWMTIAGISGANPSMSFWSSLGRGTGLLTLYHSLVLSFIVASLVNKNGLPYIVSLFQSFVFGSFILALSVWMGSEGFNLPIKVLQTDIGGGLAGNSTLTAGYFLFTLAMGAFLLSVKSLSTTRKWLIGITMAVTIFSPVFINLYGFLVGKGILGLARGTILALFTGLGAVGMGYMFLSNKKWIKGASISLVAIGVIAFSFLWIQLVTSDTKLHNQFAQEARGSRFIFWEAGQKAIDTHPLLGYGPENFSVAFQENFNPQILLSENSFEGWADRAHNIFYDLGVAGGYPVLILYFIFVLSLFYAPYMLYRRGEFTRIQASIMAGLFTAYLANNLFTFDSNLSLMALFVLAGIFYSLNDKNKKEQKFLPVNIGQSNKNIIALGLTVLFLTSFIFLVYMPAGKSKAYAETFSASIDKRPDMYAKLLDGSHIGEQWDASDLAFATHKLYISNPAGFKADKEKLPYLIKNIDGLLSYLYKVSERNQTDYRLYLTIAFFENTLTYMSDRPYDSETRDRVLAVLEKAKNLSPANPNAYWVMAQTKIWGGDFEGAEEAYRQAVLVAPYIPSSYNLLLNYAKILGDQKLFDETIMRAKENIPDYTFN